MDTQKLIEVLAREVLKEIAKRENEKLSENNEIIFKKSVLKNINSPLCIDKFRNITFFIRIVII